jgi:DNA polymerase-3 subunit epsilon
VLERYWKKFYYMLEVILDTETTGLSTTENHKIVEIGCIELDNQISTNKVFHVYINPQRTVSEDAYKVHGYSNEFLSNKKIFSEICEDFLSFIKDKKLIMHNAAFDLAFLNHELRFVNKKTIDKTNVIDTLEIARSKYPGSQNSLDALCKRFNIDNSKREKHNALIDCHLLKEIYFNLLDKKELKLNLESSGVINSKFNSNARKNNNISRKIIKLSDDELELHKKYLQSQLPKNNYN